jgi:hypothetical protein
MNKPNKTKSANLLRIGLLMSTMKKRIERLKMSSKMKERTPWMRPQMAWTMQILGKKT